MNTKILLNERPVGEPKLGNFRTVKEDIVSPKKGEVLLKTIYMSLDPYMRGRMNDAKSYAKPVGIGEVMEAGALSQVVESKSELFKAGDFVEGRTGWQDNPTVNEKKLRLIDPKMAPLSTGAGCARRRGRRRSPRTTCSASERPRGSTSLRRAMS